ncbi:hypothetical protein [Eshraghiella crossota]|jgi:hypothetical protein|uniref:hypothetical protein n=1 Tax=Eshraghiella crossota TaxID=45851 RepID=UPI003AB872E4
MNRVETVYQLNKLLRELKGKTEILLLDEEGNETNLALDGFMIKENDDLKDVIGWCHLI